MHFVNVVQLSFCWKLRRNEILLCEWGGSVLIGKEGWQSSYVVVVYNYMVEKILDCWTIQKAGDLQWNKKWKYEHAYKR